MVEMTPVVIDIEKAAARGAPDEDATDREGRTASGVHTALGGASGGDGCVLVADRRGVHKTDVIGKIGPDTSRINAGIMDKSPTSADSFGRSPQSDWRDSAPYPWSWGRSSEVADNDGDGSRGSSGAQLRGVNAEHDRHDEFKVQRNDIQHESQRDRRTVTSISCALDDLWLCDQKSGGLSRTLPWSR